MGAPSFGWCHVQVAVDDEGGIVLCKNVPFLATDLCPQHWSQLASLFPGGAAPHGVVD